LFELLECALSQLDARLQRLTQSAGSLSSSQTGAQGEQTKKIAPQQPASPPATAEQQRVLVVRIDHMHNRALYTRTLRAWMADLGITGALSKLHISVRAVAAHYAHHCPHI
jgi:hypothetical protein